MIAPVVGSGDWPAWITRVAMSCCFFMNVFAGYSVAVHHDRDAAALENFEQVFHLRGRRERFQVIGHGGMNSMIKPLRILMDFHEHVGFVEETDYLAALVNDGHLRDFG